MKEKVKSGIYKEIETVINPVFEKNGYNLVDIDIIGGKNKHIIIYIYRSDKTGIDDLESINRQIYPIIENIKFLKDGFSMELSSPGISRTIKNKEEFNIFKDKPVMLTLDKGEVKTGKLVGLINNNVEILNNDILEIFDLNIIKSAKLNG